MFVLKYNDNETKTFESFTEVMNYINENNIKSFKLIKINLDK